jgi:hypothetical protein
MYNPVLNRQHARDYFLYGGAAAFLFVLPVWYFLASADYEQSWIVYSGSILFMFAIMVYAIRLIRHPQDHKSAVIMLMAGHLAVLTGVLLSVLFSGILCLVYIPGFLSGHSADGFLQNAPAGLNRNNTGTVFQVFFPATLGNLGTGSFMSVIISYVLKPNQTGDKPAPL